MEDVFEGVVKTIISGHGFVRPKTPLPAGYGKDREVFFHVTNLKGDDVSEGDSVQFALDKGSDRQRPAAKWVKLKDGGIDELFKGVVRTMNRGNGFIRPTTKLPKSFNTENDVFFKFGDVKGTRVYQGNAVSFRLESSTFSKPTAQWVEIDHSGDSNCKEIPKRMARQRSHSLSRKKEPAKYSLPSTARPPESSRRTPKPKHQQDLFKHNMVEGATKSGNQNVESDGMTCRDSKLSNSCLGINKTMISNVFYVGRLCDLKSEYGFIKMLTKENNVNEGKDIHFIIDKVESGLMKLKVGDLLKFSLRENRINPGHASHIAFGIKLEKCTKRTIQEVDHYMQQVIEIIFSDLSQMGEESDVDKEEFLVRFLSCPATLECAVNHKEITVEIIENILNVLLYIGNQGQTLRQLVKDMFSLVWGSPLFDPRVGKFIHFIKIRDTDMTKIRQFILLSLSLAPEKAKSIIAIIQHMITSDKDSIEQFLFSVLKKTVPLGKSEADDLDWNELPLVPTAEELMIAPDESEMQLMPVKVQGSYNSPEDYIDTYFRLLRTDCFEALRGGIQKLITGKLDTRDMNVYHSVQLMGIQVTKFGTGLSIALQVTAVRKVQNWATSRQLMFGNLLCISPSGTFRDPIYVTISERDIALLQKRSIIFAEICTEVNSISDTDVITVLEENNGKSIMVETPTYYKAYEPVLRALQNMNPENMPFQNELVNVSFQNEIPCYLENTSTVDARLIYSSSKQKCSLADLMKDLEMNDKNTNLDRSQILALSHVLSNRISIIQGPPGTGKTFMGLNIIRLILSADCGLPGPILVLTYKNHALDELLKALVKHYKSDVVRIGGRAKDPALSACNLNEIKQTKKKSLGLHHELQNTYATLDAVKMHIKTTAHSFSRAKLFTPQTLLTFGSQKQVEKLLLECNWKNHLHHITLDDENDVPYQEPVTKQFVQSELDRVKSRCGNDLKIEENSVLWDILLCAISSWQPDLKTFTALKETNQQRDVSDWITDDKSKERELDIDEIDVEEEQNERMSIFTGSAVKSSDFINFQEKSQTHLHLFISTRDIPTLNVSKLMNTKNLWSLSNSDRVNYIQCLLLNQIDEPKHRLQMLLREYRHLVERKTNLEDRHKADIIATKKIIGMTITGASLHQKILEQIKPAIVLVEEAAEVLEPQLFATLGNWVQHLIMIGDQKQLRPPVQSHRLRTKYHFDVSLMERLINNKFQHSSLQLQNRMRPEFAELLLDIYPELQSNLERVCKNEKASCMDQSMFFWHHTSMELSGRSYSNEEEANRVVQLSLYFLQQRYKPEQITVLAPYQGQVTLIRRKIRQAISKYPELFEDPEDVVEKENSTRIEVHTIDLYQGDENEIVLVSLVRSNCQSSIGFLKVLNRRCVAQSRAKCGMYFVGNGATLMSSPHWQRFINNMKEQDCFGSEIKLQCPSHPDSKLLAKSASDIDLGVFCTRPCIRPMDCKIHDCSSLCQPRHSHNVCHVKVECKLQKCNHTVVKECSDSEKLIECKQACDKIMTCGLHKCDKKCGPEHLHHYCTYKVDFKFQKCGHSEKKMCSQTESEIRCETDVTFRFPRCGHAAIKKCYESVSNYLCREKCKDKMACGKHACKKNCHPEHSHEYCEVVIPFKFPKCGHAATKKCSQDESEVRCETIDRFAFPLCGHFGRKKCYENEADYHCTAKCKCYMSCSKHVCLKECWPEHSHDHCDVIVLFTFPACGHPSTKMCSKPLTEMKCAEPCQSLMSCKKHHCKEKCDPPHTHDNCFEIVRCFLQACGHSVERNCSEKETDIICKKTVSFLYPVCNHRGTKSCYMDDDMTCPRPCTKTLSCGHVCSMTCGEPCNTNSCEACKNEKELAENARLEAEQHKRQKIIDETSEKLVLLKKELHKQSYETILEKSGETAEEYYKVEDMVVKYIQSAHMWEPRITSITKVYNPLLEEKWLSARLKMFNPERHELKFHGTSKEAVANIVKEGFRIPSHPGMYGTGIYFATDSSKSQQYTKRSHILLLCDVLLGKSYQVGEPMNFLNATIVKDYGFDSVYAKRGTAVRYDEFIVYDTNQAVVKYVIYYDDNKG